MKHSILDKIRGSIVGGAVGDALGYTVEFYDLHAIQHKFGKDGITRYLLNQDGVPRFSDDTQMTLFTAEAMINGFNCDNDYKQNITDAYIEWYFTQMGCPGCIESPKCRLSEVEGLYSRRAPGNTCLSALSSIIDGVEVANNSKGCGGIMRVAPIALFAAVHGMNLDESTLLGCQAAAITHLHPMGFLPAGLMVYVLHRLLLDQDPSREKVIAYVHEGIDMLRSVFKDKSEESYSPYIDELQKWNEEAIRLSESTMPDFVCVSRLGEGWVGDECWYIALYCALRHFNDFEAAIVAAVNHSGDSDSTGAVCGNLVGAVCGYEAIQAYYKDGLEMLPLLLEVSDHLFTGEKL